MGSRSELYLHTRRKFRQITSPLWALVFLVRHEGIGGTGFFSLLSLLAGEQDGLTATPLLCWLLVRVLAESVHQDRRSCAPPMIPSQALLEPLLPAGQRSWHRLAGEHLQSLSVPIKFRFIECKAGRSLCKVGEHMVPRLLGAHVPTWGPFPKTFAQAGQCHSSHRSSRELRGEWGCGANGAAERMGLRSRPPTAGHQQLCICSGANPCMKLSTSLNFLDTSYGMSVSGTAYVECLESKQITSSLYQ